MGFCRSCGKELEEGQGFCAACGAAVRSVPQPGPLASAGAGPAIDRAAAPTGSVPLATNVAGALSYLLGFVTGIIFLVTAPYKNNAFIRFPAFQSILFNVAWVASWIVCLVVSAILTPLTSGLFGLIALPLILIFSLAGFGMWAFLMYQAYQQQLFKLPIVGKFAAQQAGVRP